MSDLPQAGHVNRMQQLMSTSPVPSISTELLVTADGELNRELNAFLFDPPSNPNLLKGKKIAICCTTASRRLRSSAPSAGSASTAPRCISSAHGSASSTRPWACAFRRKPRPMCSPFG